MMLGAALLGCAGSTVPAGNPLPLVASVSMVESDSLVLNVDVSGFRAIARVLVNQQPAATRFVSTSRLEARVGLGRATTFTGTVSVENPAPGGGVSARVPVSWTAAPAPMPTMTAVSPAVAPVGAADVVVTVTGELSGSARRLGGSVSGAPNSVTVHSLPQNDAKPVFR